MSSLTRAETRALIYFAIGVSSEGSDRAYLLSLAGTVSRNADGAVLVHPVQNSGYTIGTLQTDLGQSGGIVATQLTDAYQTWARDHQPDWQLSATQRAQTISDLSRDGHQIKTRDHGRDLDALVKSHLQTFLESDAGTSFIHARDVAQVDKLVSHVVTPLSQTDLYQHSNAVDQAKLITMVAKAYNQNESIGQTFIDGVVNGSYGSIANVIAAVDSSITYIRQGKDRAMPGVELFNALQKTPDSNPIQIAWQDVLADPLPNPTQLSSNIARPDLKHSNPAIRDLFVDPLHGLAMVHALEKSHSYGAAAGGRGFFGEGNDFVLWDRYGHGHAYSTGVWRTFDRTELTIKANTDRTLDLGVRQDGMDRPLVHMEHPSSTALRYAQLVGEDHVQHPGSLREHDRGPQVVLLQSELAAWNRSSYDGKDVTIDGDFGHGTRTALEAFQRSHGLPANGIADTPTLEALKQTSLQQEALTVMTLDHPQHPGFPLFQQAATGVGRIDQAQGRATDFLSYNLSGALALAARKEGLERIDQVILSEDASRAIAVQDDIRSPLRRFAVVDVMSGISTPLVQSSTDWSQFQVQGTQNMRAPTPLMQSADAQVAQPSMQR